MIKHKVYITRALPAQVFDFLGDCIVEVNEENHKLTKQELLAKVKGQDAVVVVSNAIDEEICQAVKGKCKIFANYGVGYNNIDVEAATRHGIYVTNTPDVVTDATADLAWALLLATARRVIECDKFVRSGQKSWGPMNLLGTQVSGKTLGIVGGGRIGLAMAQRAQGFKMNVIYTGTRSNPVFEAATGGKFVDQESLLKNADFISIHVPLLPSTRHLFSVNEFKLMKKTAILINTARGPVLDEKALAEALRAGELAGAGLDVFEQEPDIESGLTDLSNVVLAPHVGTSTLDARIDMAAVCAKNIIAALNDQMPPNCLNPQAKLNQS